MTKQHFIALADSIRQNNSAAVATRNAHLSFDTHHLGVLADFCAAQNPAFNRSRWLAYVAGDCGPDGGKLKR